MEWLIAGLEIDRDPRLNANPWTRDETANYHAKVKCHITPDQKYLRDL